jgi:hypothetical protein
MPVFYGLVEKILAKKLMITEDFGAGARAAGRPRMRLKVPAALPIWIVTGNFVLAEPSAGRM